MAVESRSAALIVHATPLTSNDARNSTKSTHVQEDKGRRRGRGLSGSRHLPILPMTLLYVGKK